MDQPANIITCTYFSGESQCGKPTTKLVNNNPCCNTIVHVNSFKNEDGTEDIILPLDISNGEHPRKVV